MQKTIGMMLLFIGVSGVAMAIPAPVPEIDPGTGVSALALLSGALLMMRHNRKK
jgi:hypothetical protein